MTRPNNPSRAWGIHAADFTGDGVFAQQDWRYLMFHGYLRISPSYALALQSDTIDAFSQRWPDAELERLHQVWQTRQDLGNVFRLLFKDWWLERGLRCFGIHAQRPRVIPLARLSPREADERLTAVSRARVARYISDRYQQQGRPDTLLIAIPLAQRASLSLKQVKRVINQAVTKTPPLQPAPTYQLQANKMQMQRLVDGLRLVYFRAARPKEELWRVASRARISATHQLDPDTPKKDVTNANSRRLLTIMASRLLRETLIVAEHAAMGRFPCNEPLAVAPVDYARLKKRLHLANRRDNARREELVAQAEAEAEAKVQPSGDLAGEQKREQGPELLASVD